MSRARMLTIALFTIFMITVSGCLNSPPSKMARFNDTVYVVDRDGKSINYQADIYQYTVQFSPGSPMGWVSKGNGTGITDENGAWYGDEEFGSVGPGDYFVIGASTNESLLNDDLANKQFSPGKAGFWKVFTYDDIQNITGGNENFMINATALVSNETGMMLK